MKKLKKEYKRKSILEVKWKMTWKEVILKVSNKLTSIKLSEMLIKTEL